MVNINDDYHEFLCLYKELIEYLKLERYPTAILTKALSYYTSLFDVYGSSILATGTGFESNMDVVFENREVVHKTQFNKLYY